MKLVYTCKGCSKDRELHSEAKTREELTEEAGDQKFEVICPFCKINQSIHVNHVTAIKTSFNIFAPVIYWVIALIVLMLLIPKSASLIALTLSFLAPIYGYNRIQAGIRNFNSIRIFDDSNQTN